MIRMLLADDHPVVRSGLKALLSAEDDIEVVADVGTAREAVACIEQQPVDLVLMDLQFGGEMQGVEATRLIRALPQPPYVLILTNYGTDTDILGAIEAGASGYLLKDAPPGEIVAAIRAAASGQSALAPSVVTRLMHRVQTPNQQLSQREAEVLGLVAEGMTNVDIGKRLFLSEATVKSHLVHIFGKLGVTSRTAAVAEARNRGVIR